MAVKLRLQRQGSKRNPFYRVVAAEHESPRDGKFIKIVGTYNPIMDPPLINLKEDLVKKYVDCGAGYTRVVRDLVVKTIPGYIEGIEENRTKKIKEKRAKRKARASK